MNDREIVEEFLPILEAWFGGEMAMLYRSRPQRMQGALLMGCPVFGDKYLDIFESYCLPTILSEKNLAALAGRCVMVLFTDEPSSARLVMIIDQIESLGIDCQLIIIPMNVMAEAFSHPFNKYWILGVAQNAMIKMAGRAGMGFHMLMPDHIYAHEYFPNLFRLSRDYEGIAQTGISAHVGAFIELEEWRDQDKTIAIPDRNLGTIGWANLHKQTRAAIMNDATIPNDLPPSHFLLWQGRDKLRMHCCHMNAAYLSARMCAQAKPRIPATIDAELPSFMPEKFHVPLVDDGMTFIEVSDDTKGHIEENRDFETFAMHCWTKVRFSEAWMPYFKKPCEVPIAPQNSFVTDEEMKHQFKVLLNGLYGAKAAKAFEFLEGLAFNR